VLLTVFTPTYNRRHLLPRLYESLRAQTQKDFEWLVIDDGSSDGTEDLFTSVFHDDLFPIRLRRTENRGKHAASNTAAELARGEFMMSVDSDDWLTPDAIHILSEGWDAIEPSMRDRFCGVGALNMKSDGTPLTRLLGADWLDARPIEMGERYGFGGDKSEMFRVDMLRACPFPEEGVTFVPEGLIWNRVSRDHEVRYLSQYVKFCDYQATGLSARGRELRMRNSRIMIQYYAELQAFYCHLLPWKSRAKARVNEIRYLIHSGASRSELYRTPLLSLLAIALALWDNRS
jgi:glycosyltransferase involved in cell wall biosynthesis